MLRIYPEISRTFPIRIGCPRTGARLITQNVSAKKEVPSIATRIVAVFSDWRHPIQVGSLPGPGRAFDSHSDAAKALNFEQTQHRNGQSWSESFGCLFNPSAGTHRLGCHGRGISHLSLALCWSPPIGIIH